jgi:hypothetical protein
MLTVRFVKLPRRNIVVSIVDRPSMFIRMMFSCNVLNEDSIMIVDLNSAYRSLSS